jgi:hypothetical protein
MEPVWYKLMVALGGFFRLLLFFAVVWDGIAPRQQEIQRFALIVRSVFKDIFQVLERLEIVLFCRLNDGVNDGTRVRSLWCRGEQPILPPYDKRLYASLRLLS